LKHLITFLEEFQALGVAFVSLAEGIDATTPAGRLQMHILGAIAEFERGRIRERVMAGLQRARTQGKRLERFPLRRSNAVAAVPGIVSAFVREEEAERRGDQAADLFKVPRTGGAQERFQFGEGE